MASCVCKSENGDFLKNICKIFFFDQLMYYEFKMVDPALRKVHTETNQGEIFKVFEEEIIFQLFQFSLAECTTLPI